MLAMKAVLNNEGTFELQYGVSLAENRIKDIADDMTPSRYLPKHSRSSNVRYVRFSRLMKRNTVVLSLLESLNEGRKEDKELGISHLDRNLLHASRGRIVFLLIEAAYIYINEPTKSTDFHASSLYRLGKQLLQRLFELFDEVNILAKQSFLGFMSEKLSKAPDERRSIDQLYLNNMRLLGYDPRDKKKRWA